MHRSQPKASRLPRASVRSAQRTLSIHSSFCATAHHDQCRHTIFDRGVVFCCICPCHNTAQLDLPL